MYENVLKDLSKNNRCKVSAAAVAREWNARIDGMVANAVDERAKSKIMKDYGCIGAKDARDHADRLKVRMIQTDHTGEGIETVISFGDNNNIWP